MKTAKQLCRELQDADLRALIVETIAWRRSGLLTGNLLRDFSARLIKEAQMSEDDSLRQADELIVEEAAIRFAKQNPNLSSKIT